MTKTKLGKSDMNILLTLSSILVAMTMFGLLFSVIPASGDGPPPIPHRVEGKICYSDDTPVVGASVTLNNTRTDEEVPETTDENGEWRVEVADTIHASNGDEILITASINADKTQSKILVVDRSEEPQIVEDFVFEKESESPGDGSGDGGSSDGGSASGGSSSEGTTPVPTPAEAKSNAADKETDTEQQPSPSQSESIEDEDEAESETPSPLLGEGDNAEEGTGKSKGIPGFQFLYAGLVALIAIAAFFSIRKLRGRKILRGGEKR